MSGNKSIEAFIQAGIKYDSSWPTFFDHPYFPYTLDYQSNQVCFIGSCPTGTYASFIVAPIVNMIGSDGNQCNSIYGCQIG